MVSNQLFGKSVTIEICTGNPDGSTSSTIPGNEIKEEHSVKSQHRLGVRGKIDPDVGGSVRVSGADHDSKSLEILKCIVYGGLIESITSLSIVSSAAASDATTLNITAIGLATLFSGLIVFGQNLMELKNNVSGGKSNQCTDKYQELLGTGGHFVLHASFAVLSFLLFGLVAPMTYGFAFRKSDNKDYKILAVAAASFACIFILAITKAYVRRSGKLSDYVKTVLYYVTMAISVSGIAYAAGDLITMAMEKLGWLNRLKIPIFPFPDDVSNSSLGSVLMSPQFCTGS